MARNNRSDRDDRYQDYDNYEDYERSMGGAHDDRYEDDHRDSRSGRGDGRYADDGYADDGYEDDYGDGPQDDRGYAGDDSYAGDDGYDDGYYRGSDDYDDDYDDDRRYSGRNPRGGYDDRAGRRNEKQNRNSRTGNSGRPVKQQQKAKKKKKRLVLFAVEIIILLIVLGALYVVTRTSKVGKVTLDDSQLSQNMSAEVKADTETGAMKGYRNIVLFGVDGGSNLSRSDNLGSGDNRSDTIIIASINEDTKDVKLVSVYRDTYLNLGNDSYNKCNAAYAKGGPEQAINMLNMNLDMNITDFVTIGLRGLTDVVDALGGIDVDIQEDEISHLNNYQLSMTDQLNYPYTEITQAGTQHLNGLQATAYCRIRYTAGSDFKRAERQRSVIMKCVEKAKQADAATLSKTANDLFDEVYTSMDVNEILTLLSNVSSYNITDQNGFPQEDTREVATIGAKGSCIVPEDLAANDVWLHQFLFGDQSYTVSSEVQTCSDQIKKDTAGYVSK